MHVALFHLVTVLRALALALAMACIAFSTQAQETRISLEEARALAARLLAEGRPQSALVLAEGVLLAEPDDVPALLLKSRALRDLGRPREALKFAKAGWNAAPNDRDKYFSALAASQARTANGNPLSAQIWLRRAAQVAPEPRLKGLAVRDFREVRRRNPLMLRFDAFAAPTSNLNNAPKSNRMTFAGLDFVNPAAVPLSGLRYGAELQAVYTVPVSQNRRLHFGAALYRERVALSDEARSKVPTARNLDYARDLVELIGDYEMRGADGRWLARVGVRAGREWRAGNLYATSRGVALSYGRGLGKGWRSGVTAELRSEVQHQARLRDSRTLRLGGYVSKTLQNGARLRLDLSHQNRDSDSAAIAHEARSATLSYSMAQPVWGMLPRVSFGVTDYDYDQALYGPAPRADRAKTANVTVVLPGLNYFGFAPEVGVTWRDTSSNYSLFESTNTDLRLGVRSVF